MQVAPAFTYNDHTGAVDVAPKRGYVNRKWGTVCGWGYYLVMLKYFLI